MHLRRVHLTDNGTYTCMAMNSEGRVNISADIIVRSEFQNTNSATTLNMIYMVQQDYETMDFVKLS